MLRIYVVLLLFFVTPLAIAKCYSEGERYAFRIGPNDKIAYDADTIYITDRESSPGISRRYIRVRDIDAPEIRGKCAAEKKLALQARDYVVQLLETKQVQFCDLGIDKYGRVLANVYVDGVNLSEILITLGYARKYNGKAKESWCD